MDCLLAFLTILFISFFYTAKLEMRTSSAHLASCATVILALTLFGCLGILSVGVVVVYVSAVALFLMAVISSRRLERSFRTLIGTFFTPATLLFIVCSVTIYVICVIRQPAFRHWDEFSFWGIAAKVIWSCRELYTTAGTSMITSAYLPGLPLFGAFFQYFFNPLFTEYKVYIAYDVLMIASLVAVIGDTKWKDYLRWIVGFVFCISVPGLFSSCYGWMNPMFSAYSDTVLGLVFGGALLAWFMHEEKDAGVWISVFLDVALLTCMKDIGMAFGLGIGMLITADLILRKKKAQDGIKRSRLRTAINCLLVYVIPVVVYIAWLKYFTSVTGIVSSEIPYEYSMVDILIRGKDPRFFNFLRMEVAALSQQLVNFGSIRLMSLVFLAYPICAVFFISDRNRILRVAVLSVLLLMGFVVYNIFFAYLYTAVFHTEEIVNYQRYMSSYVIGWFMAVSGVAWFDSECRSSVGKILKTVLTVALMIRISVCAVFFKSPMETDVSSTGTRAQYDSWFLKYAC